MDKKELTQQIKAEAQRLGFTLTGVTTPAPPDHLDFFHNWLSKGFHASMDWIASERSLERRSDPRVILPECKSILVLGTPYPAPKGNLKGGNIASYALNQDYHDVLPDKLKSWWSSWRRKLAIQSQIAGIPIQVPFWSVSWPCGPVWAGSEKTPC